MVRVLEHEGGVVQFTMARRVLGRELYRVSCYWVDGILVDTGMAHTTRDLLARLAGYPVRVIVNTHAHEDHIAGNLALQQRHRIPILAHPLALDVIARPAQLALRPYQRFLFGTPKGSRASAIPDHLAWREGEFQVVPTPGHSRDQIALFEPRRGWLFSGDAYLGGRERVLRSDYDVWETIFTYERLLRLPLRVVFAGTGQVVRDPVERFERKVTHLRGLSERIWSLHDTGLGEEEIARRVLGRDVLVRFLTSGHFSARHLVSSFLARRPASTPVA